MNELFKRNGLQKLEDVTPQNLDQMIPGCFPDARQVEIVDKVLKRVGFAMGAGYYTLYADPKNGDRFIQFEGDNRFLKVNKSDRFDELNAQDEADKAKRRAEREARANAQTEGWVKVVRKRVSRSESSGNYPVDRTFTPVKPEDIAVGHILLLKFGNGSQLYVVEEVSGPRGLLGRRLNNRGTRRAAWCVPGDSKNEQSWISRFDKRIYGLGRLVPQDPRP